MSIDSGARIWDKRRLYVQRNLGLSRYRISPPETDVTMETIFRHFIPYIGRLTPRDCNYAILKVFFSDLGGKHCCFLYHGERTDESRCVLQCNSALSNYPGN